MNSTTVLARQLAAGRPSRPTALDAFKLAREQFIAGQRIEMQPLAQELGVSRVTLHRWVGSRDQLLGEVLWSLGKLTFDRARTRIRSHGGQAVADAMERFLEDVLAAPFMRAFLQREGEIALRILTTTRSSFQANLVAYIGDLITAEMSDHTLPLGLDDLAYLVTRIGESFFYIDIIAGGEPDPHKAGQAIAALLT
jgi:AcrR family transcriptional regulator